MGIPSPGTATDSHVTLAIPFYSLTFVFLIFTRKVRACKSSPSSDSWSPGLSSWYVSELTLVRSVAEAG